MFKHKNKLALLIMFSGCVYPVINKDNVDTYVETFHREKQMVSVVRWSLLATGVGCIAYIWFKQSSNFTKGETKELQDIAAKIIARRKQYEQENKNDSQVSAEPVYVRLKNTIASSAKNCGRFAVEQGKSLGTMIMQQTILGLIMSKINSLIGFMDFSRDALMVFLTQRTKLSSVLSDLKNCLEQQESDALAIEVERLEGEIERILGYMVFLKRQVVENDVLIHKHCQFQINRLEKITNDLTNALYSLSSESVYYVFIADLERFDRLVKEICYSFAAAIE